MKKRWRGLCALWMVLALVIGVFPVSGAAEGVPESAAAAVSENFSEEMPEGGSLDGERAEMTAEEKGENSAKDETEEPSEQSAGPEETAGGTEETEAVEGTETPEETEAPEETKAPEEIEAPKETEAPGETEAPKETETTGETKAPEETKTPEETEAPKETEATEATEEGEKESETDETAAKSPEDILVEGEKNASVNETAAAEEIQEEGSQQEELETTAPELPENVALPVKAAAAREAAVSGEAWLYVGSDEVGTGSYIGNEEDAASYRKQVTVLFDQSFDSQEEIMNITVPADKKLNGWKLWGFNESGYVRKDSGELEIAGQISEEDYPSVDSDGSSLFLLIVPLWRDAKDILDGDALVMSIGDSCRLSAGTWQVEGDTAVDTTVYTGGRTLYAARSGTFTFHKKE